MKGDFFKRIMKTACVAVSAVMLCSAFGCANGNQNGGETERKSEITLGDVDYAYFSGRVYEDDGAFCVNNTASGLKIVTDSTDLYLTASASECAEGKTYVCVVINGEKYKTLEMGFEKLEYALFENLPAEKRVVEVLKSTEAQYSSLKLYSVRGNGDFYKVPAKSDKKIVFFGDSITCGYGNLGDGSFGGYVTKEQDGLETYAYLTAKAMNAEIDVMAASGWAIVKASWHTTDMRIPRVYDKYSPTDDDKVYLGSPDYSADFVVVNLGTNDYTYYFNHKNELKEFENAYYAFYDELRTNYPIAQIVLTIGMMNWESLIYTMEPYVKNVCERANNEGDKYVYFTELYTAVKPEDLGSNGHPTVLAQKKAAEKLIEFLSSLED